ncbi:gamma aminobutyric acid receptor subunit, partial [Plakobranchus ocellatus]
ELSVVLSSDLPLEAVDLVGDFFRASSVNWNALETAQDWSSYVHVELTRDVTTQEMAGTSKHSVLVVSARVKRKLGFYFWNVFIIVCLIEGMTLVFLAVDPTGSTRLSLSMTLFFTAVAYKLVVKNTLPTISYLTYLDMYVGFVMVYLFMWAAVNALICHVARYRDKQSVMEYDEIAQISLISFLVLFHLLFLIYIQLTALSRRRQMKLLDTRHEALSRRRQMKLLDTRHESTTRCDLRLSGPPSGQGAGSGARTRDRRSLQISGRTRKPLCYRRPRFTCEEAEARRQSQATVHGGQSPGTHCLIFLPLKCHTTQFTAFNPQGPNAYSSFSKNITLPNSSSGEEFTDSQHEHARICSHLLVRINRRSDKNNLFLRFYLTCSASWVFFATLA